MRTTILIGCTAIALAAAGCGKTAEQAHGTPGHTRSSTTSAAPSSSSPAAPTTTPPPTSPPNATVKPPLHTAPPSKPPTSTTRPTGTTGPTSTAGPTAVSGSRCHTSDLWAVFQSLGAAAGNLYGKIVLTNHSDGTCTVYGYGGIGLYAGNGSAVPTHQIRDRATAPVTVTLRPGDHAYSRLHWSDVTGTGDSQTGQCEPTAATLKVIPPDETRPLDAHWPGSPACERGRIEQTAYRAGTGPSGGG